MKRAVITVGLGFGDEGKGATVDYLTRRLGADLVVRYCGGCQAGHNVQLPDGRRHTFSQFGAGTLAPERPRTYLGPAMVIDPPALFREAQHLLGLGVPNPLRVISAHPRCLVTTPWLKLLNRVRETARGDSKHGSCGLGVGEARNYWLRYGEDAVFAADLSRAESLRHKLELQRQRVLLEAQPLIENLPPDVLRDLDADPWNSTAEEIADELSNCLGQELNVAADVPEHRMAILEGAQGVLLDEYRGFHPFTTWSTVTAHHAWELVARMESEAVAVLGITRAYTTRHGAGPMPTHSPEMTARLADPGNPWNRWQGHMRCGPLDLPLLRYAADVSGPFDGLVVNHLDQLDERDCQVCESYREIGLMPSPTPNLARQAKLTEQLLKAEPILTASHPVEVLRLLSGIAPVVITGRGPAYTDRTGTELPFRKKRA